MHFKGPGLAQMVSMALSEDVGSGDVTAQLVSKDAQARAKVITRENMVVCGCDWVREVFKQVDPSLELVFKVADGEAVAANSVLFHVSGNARSILTGERNALNFLQMLSGTATVAAQYAKILLGTQTKLLDTRKTIPLYREAQKYAVLCGGGHNHRMGLYDAFLIKENHIAACGSIKAAIEMAKALAPGKSVEVEVENLEELEQALAAEADIVMLDNFDVTQMHQAVALNQGRAKLEVSGNITHERLSEIAQSGVDFVSSGALTKHLQAIDLSLRFES